MRNPNNLQRAESARETPYDSDQIVSRISKAIQIAVLTLSMVMADTFPPPECPEEMVWKEPVSGVPEGVRNNIYKVYKCQEGKWDFRGLKIEKE